MTELVASPFGTRQTVVTDTAGARQDQSRELAETQVKYLMAQQFPRDVVRNMDNILNAFTRLTLAEQSQYQFSRGGSDISGPSIRAAEAMAQQWGNIEHGFRERSRGVDATGVPFSEVEAFCVDLESRTSKRLQFIVRHWRDTKSGGYKLKEERDIYELIANQAQRRVRACILAQIPGDVVDAAMQQANVTLNTKADVSPEGIQKIVTAFEQFGVTKEHVEKRIQRRLESIQPAQVVTLKRIYASLRDGMSAPGEWFEMEQPATTGESTTLKDIAKQASGKKAPKQAPQSNAPEFAPQQLIDLMRSRKDIDTLSADASMIGSLPEDDQQPALDVYNECLAALSA
ncbi:hypothetical protein AWB76_03254 [Caballeronia temeraria]|uniref:Uncharacterized protein n=1 Tax=Caballeronia temeraria TaxID=1777137 RepID=A0A158AZN8_9BURK|nr:hypothetical protein [Caballeronia temeraria]SAK62487.1 hypothetical protein AWB76_03254 [Caballeronia temeraria]